MKKSFFVSVFTVSAISMLVEGCVPQPIDINVEPAESKLVVASQAFPSQTVLVALTKSFSPLAPLSNNDSISQADVDKIIVSNAFVTLTYNSRIDTLQMITPGVYISFNTLLSDYTTYSLYAKDASGAEITAVTSLLPQVKFDTVYPYITRSPEDTVVSVHYELTDNTSQENFYVVNFILKQPSKGGSLDLGSYFSSGSNKILSSFDLLTDDSFTSGKLTKDIAISSDIVTYKDTIAVEVAHISKDYYEFLTVYRRSGNPINQLTGEPINYPSNVRNGYGYFNMHYPDGKIFFLTAY